ncbi:hypothetical protein Echvi_3025 [Echinicola vietnamensis DSM 17526]|uniref:Uncharacterized protein n=1 Tax=Echinicola vietnamensis (strain DSM 17526 / LMG 23754 / KMM 6221) TaxID=926556 RepID=L0G1S4_ECHVK|nr:hypothetical protein Echvi_3025 [Echinicola vietnamensis DSM 17526]
MYYVYFKTLIVYNKCVLVSYLSSMLYSFFYLIFFRINFVPYSRIFPWIDNIPHETRIN